MSIERRRHHRQKATRGSGQLVLSRSGHPDELKATILDASDYGFAIQLCESLSPGAKIHVFGTMWGTGARQCMQSNATVRWCTQASASEYLAGLETDEPVKWQQETAEWTRSRATDESVDYYEVLQLSPNASPDTIHRVYRLLAQRLHPDNPETGDEETFKRVLEAYRVLSDAGSRASYDACHRAAAEVRWKIFDSAAATQGVEAERRKRAGVLAILYTKRLNDPDAPGLNVQEISRLLGCPHEHLQLAMWYLKESGCLSRGDNGRYSITFKGVDAAEAADTAPVRDRRLLAS